MSFISDLLFGSPPDPPDYAGAAKVQGDANIESAKLNAAMNRLNETNPYGSVKYTSTKNDATPGGFDYGRDITLSPEQQQLYNLESGNQITSQQIAQGLQGDLRKSVQNPFSLGKYGASARMGGSPNFQDIQDTPDVLGVNGPEARDLGTAATYGGGRDAVTKAMFDRAMALRKPQMEQDTAQLDNRLRQQGLMPGTEAYDNEANRLAQQQSQDTNDLSARAIEAGGAEQSRLAGLDMGLDSQRFGQSQTAFQDQLQKITNALTQRLSTAGFRNQNAQQGFQNQGTAAGFNNQARGQDIQEGLLERQQPLSEYNAFRTGNTPTIPQFQPYGMVSSAPPNLYGAAKDTYGAQSNAYNQTMGGVQSLLNFGSKFAGAPAGP